MMRILSNIIVARELKEIYHYAKHIRENRLARRGQNRAAKIKSDLSSSMAQAAKSTWYSKGSTLSDQGKYKEAIQAYDGAINAYDMAIRLDPNDSKVWRWPPSRGPSAGAEDRRWARRCDFCRSTA